MPDRLSEEKGFILEKAYAKGFIEAIKIRNTEQLDFLMNGRSKIGKLQKVKLMASKKELQNAIEKAEH